MKELADWQKRVVDEKRELDLKVDRLSRFINDPEGDYCNMGDVDKGLLAVQLFAMLNYSGVLEKRIALWGEAGAVSEGNDQP